MISRKSKVKAKQEGMEDSNVGKHVHRPLSAVPTINQGKTRRAEYNINGLDILTKIKK